MTKTVSEQRTYNYLKQIKGSFIFKGLAIAASFVTIPLMIRYLGQEQYGIWSTLLSVMSWVVFFDLGIGNGLRNKLTESLAKKELSNASNFISSGYTLIGLVSFFSFIITVLVSIYIPWQKVFNTSILSNEILRNTVMVSVFCVTFNFWISLINQILNAVQKTSVIVFGQFISNLIALILVFILTKVTTTSLFYIAISYGSSLIISNIILSVWFFNKNRELIPKLALNKQHIQPIISLGLQFFLIQIAALIIYTTAKMLITQLYEPSLVTQYDIVFKLFSVVTLIYSTISAPLWSSYTDAYHRDDFMWIKSTLRKQFMLFVIMFIFVLLITMFAKRIITLWIGHDIQVSSELIISMGIFVIISIWTNIFASFLNGVGKIRASLLISIITMFLNIPSSILLSKYTSLDASAVVLGMIIALLPVVIAGPYQTYKILSHKENGIWNL